MAGIKENEGVVIARNREGPAHIEQLSETNWYIAQTNDDHWTGACRDRCQGANSHIQAIGSEGFTIGRFLEEVMFAGPNMNDQTIFTAMMSPKLNVFDTYWVDSDIPYVHMAIETE